MRRVQGSRVLTCLGRASLGVALGWGLGESPASGALPEVRGTWVTTTGLINSTSAINTPAATSRTYDRLRAIGLNTVYMDIWRNGYTYYNSPTNAAITDAAMFPGPPAGSDQRDFLQEAVLNGHRNQMAVLGWFQYGLMPGYGSSPSATKVATWANNNGYLLKNSSGGVINNPDTNGNGFMFMNPLQPAVQSYITNLLLDAVKNYDIDGIQLDDHMAWPVAMGYDSYTVQVYKSENGGASPPTNPNDANFIRWRANKLTAFMTTLTSTLRAARPGIILSVSPGSWVSCYNNYCVDWPTWQKNGLFDEYIPQCYTTSLSSFNSAWSIQQAQMPNALSTLGAGVLLNPSAPTPAPDFKTVVTPEINATRSSSGFAGQVFWFVDGVLTNEANLAGYYNVATNGYAVRPDMVNDPLPAPLVGTLSGSSFSFNVTVPGYYDLISYNGSAWGMSSQNVLVPAGTYTTAISGATNAQLLFKLGFAVVPEPGCLVILLPLGLSLARRR